MPSKIWVQKSLQQAKSNYENGFWGIWLDKESDLKLAIRDAPRKLGNFMWTLTPFRQGLFILKEQYGTLLGATDGTLSLVFNLFRLRHFHHRRLAWVSGIKTKLLRTDNHIEVPSYREYCDVEGHTITWGGDRMNNCTRQLICIPTMGIGHTRWKTKRRTKRCQESNWN